MTSEAASMEARVGEQPWWLVLLQGIALIIAGLLILQHPLWSAILVPGVMVWILGIYGIVAGIVALIRAFQGAGWGVGVLGVVAILLGIFFLANTLVSAVLLVFMTALVAIIGGVFGIIMAFRLR